MPRNGRDSRRDCAGRAAGMAPRAPALPPRAHALPPRRRALRGAAEVRPPLLPFPRCSSKRCAAPLARAERSRRAPPWAATARRDAATAVATPSGDRPAAPARGRGRDGMDGSVVPVPASRGERVHRRRVVGLPRVEPRRREVRVVRRVGEVLGLQRQPVALAVLAAARAVERAVEEVARSRTGSRAPWSGSSARRPLDGSTSTAARLSWLACLGALRTQLWS